MKSLITSLALSLVFAGTVHAQTSIWNNEQLLAKNERTSFAKLSVRDEESPAMPGYIMPVSDHRRRNDPAGKNIMTGSPINLLVVNNYGCYAFGLTYERLLGDEEVIGIQVPLYFGFGNNDWLSGDEGRMYYSMPGVQFHVSPKRKFDYAVGPSLLLGNLYERRERYNGSGNNYTYTEYNTFASGIMLDNNLNFQRNHFLFGIHAAFGTTWRNDRYPNQFFMQLGVRFGGLF